MVKKQSSPIWIPISVIAIVIGALLLLMRPIKSNGIFSKQFDFKPSLGAQLPGDAVLKESDGRTHLFGEYFRTGRPIVLLPIFYNCNGVCYTETESLTKMLVVETALSSKRAPDSVVPGRDFDLVVVSIHPKETPELAAAKKAEMLAKMRQAWEKLPAAKQDELNADFEKGVHFTVGNPDEVRKLTDTMGFFFTYDEKRDWVNHPAVAAFVATSGKIVAYNTGSDFQTKSVRNNVHESIKGAVQPLGDVFLLGCFKMDASSPRTRTIVQILNISAVATFLCISFLIWRFNKQYPSNTLPSGGPRD